MTTKFIGSGYPSEGSKYYTQTEVDTLVAGVATSSHTHTNYQPINSNLTAFSGLTGTSNKLAYFTGAGALSLTDLTAMARTLLGNSDATTMRSTLGLVIGTNVQAYNTNLAAIAGLTGTSGYVKKNPDGSWAFDTPASNFQPVNANLTAISGLTSAADRLPYFTGSGTASLATFTSAGRTLVSGADAAAMRSTLGLVIGTNVQAYSSTLNTIGSASVTANSLLYFNNLSAATSASVGSFGLTLLGSSNAGAAQTSLGLVPGTDVQPYSVVLGVLNTLGPSASGRIPISTGTSSGYSYVTPSTVGSTLLVATNETMARQAIVAAEDSAGLQNISSKANSADTGVYRKSTTGTSGTILDGNLGGLGVAIDTTNNGFIKKVGAGSFTIDTASYQPANSALTDLSNGAGNLWDFVSWEYTTNVYRMVSTTSYDYIESGAYKRNYGKTFTLVSGGTQTVPGGPTLPAGSRPTATTSPVQVSLIARTDTDPYIVLDVSYYITKVAPYGNTGAVLVDATTTAAESHQLRNAVKDDMEYGITNIFMLPSNEPLYFTLAARVALHPGATSGQGRLSYARMEILRLN